MYRQVSILVVLVREQQEQMAVKERQMVNANLQVSSHLGLMIF